MASLVLSGDTSGSVTLAAPAVAGSTTQTLVAATGTLAPLIAGTAITLTNQTAPEFTDIPSWVKRITISYQGLSTNGATNPVIQLGTGSTTYTTSGYLGACGGAGNGSTVVAANFTNGFGITASIGSASIYHGAITITNVNGNNWAAFGVVGLSNVTNVYMTGGSIALGGALTAVRLFIDGTQQFDAGSINILYE